MESTNQTTQSVEYKDCLNLSGELYSETASINFDESEKPSPGDLCIYQIEGMNKFGLAHLSEEFKDGVKFEFTDSGRKRQGGFTPKDKVKKLHRVHSVSVSYE